MASVQDQACNEQPEILFMVQRTIALPHSRKGFIMTGNRRFSGFGRFVGTLGSAIALASAVESGRRPLARDLEILGIDPRQFTKIRHY